MKKLLPLLIGALFLNNITQTYASSTPSNSANVKTFEQVIPDSEKSECITVNKNDLLPKIISKLFIERGWTQNRVYGCAVRIPKNFNPNPLHGQLLHIEALGISKIEVKIYNNWGVQVAASTLSGEFPPNYATKKLNLKQNEIQFNQEMKEGTYYYVLDICCFNGEKTIKEGEIRLMKTQKK